MKRIALCWLTFNALCASSCVVQTELIECEVDTAVLCPYDGPEGVGQCRAGVKRCQEDGSYGPCAGEVVPRAEDCSTPFDDDCDGEVNEECACSPNALAVCYSGPADAVDVGACRTGLQVCREDGSGFDPCEGEILPVDEDCTTPLDDDCDGQVNEGCECVPRSLAPCYSGPLATLDVGACKGGTQICNAEGTAYAACVGDVLPSAAEDCATLSDDDCDGQANDPAAGCVCLPGEIESCYSGPPDTESVGACASGWMACNAEGTGFGPCKDEAKPSIEYCGTIADENCDGDVSCHGYCAWAAAFGAADEQNAEDVLFDPFGNVLVTGNFKGQVDLGGGPLTSSGGYDLFLAKLDPQGKPVWSKKYGDAADQSRTRVATDAMGNVFLAGGFNGTIDFDPPCNTLISQGSGDVFVAKLDPDGTCIWSKRFGGVSDDSADDIEVDHGGDILLSTFFGGTVDFGGGPLATKGAGGQDFAVVKLDSNGGHSWSKSFGSPSGGPQRAYRLALDKADNIVLTGHLLGTVDYGGGALSSAGGYDAFALKLTPVGGHVWSKRFGDSADQFGTGIATDSSGDVFISGAFDGTVDLGGGPLVSAAPSVDGFIAAFAPGGTALWSIRFGGVGWDSTGEIAVDGADSLLVTGWFAETVDFGGGTVTSIGNMDAFAMKLDALRQPLWRRTFGSLTSQQFGTAVAADGLGGVVVAGKFFTAINPGCGAPLDAKGNSDAFVIKLSP